MNFQSFLGEVRTKGRFASSKDFFDSLNLTGELKMSLRNFQLLERGDQAPTFKAFSSIFKRLERSQYKEAVIAFLKSNLDPIEDAELLNYVSTHLPEAIEESEQSIWETPRPSLFYSNEQMTALTADDELMRLHHTLLLYEAIPLQKLQQFKAQVEELVRFELAFIEDEQVKTIRTLVRVPNHHNSAPNAVRKASKMLIKHLNIYANLEGHQNQVISYAIQHIPITRLKEALEKMESFKRWIHTLASPKTDDSVIPFIYLAWGKGLSHKELSYDREHK